MAYIADAPRMRGTIASAFARVEARGQVIGWDYEPTQYSWREVMVVDKDTGKELEDVIACNAYLGEATVLQRDSEGRTIMSPSGKFCKHEHISGRFAILPR